MKRWVHSNSSSTLLISRASTPPYPRASPPATDTTPRKWRISTARRMHDASSQTQQTRSTIDPGHAPPLDQSDDGKESHAKRTQDDERCKYAGRVELRRILRHEIAQPRAGADPFLIVAPMTAKVVATFRPPKILGSAAGNRSFAKI